MLPWIAAQRFECRSRVGEFVRFHTPGGQCFALDQPIRSVVVDQKYALAEEVVQPGVLLLPLRRYSELRGELECAPLPFDALDRQIPAHLLDKSAADPEPEAGSP